MLREISKSVRQDGFAFLPTFRPGKASEEIAHLLGWLEIIAGVPLVQTLSPKAKGASTLNLYSGNFGYSEFPLHTDLAHWFIPPRYILLRCRTGHNAVETMIKSFDKALVGVPPTSVRRARFKPRRTVRGRGQLLPLLQQLDSNLIFRWDSLFIVPDNCEAFAISETLRQTVSQELMKLALSSAGDTLIIDNWRMLHGRSNIPSSAIYRAIERVYLRELRSHDT
jgi:alpha-ketoglutarate-dependent taurine dioxygenase